MTKRKRRNHSPVFKAKIALAAVEESVPWPISPSSSRYTRSRSRSRRSGGLVFPVTQIPYSSAARARATPADTPIPARLDQDVEDIAVIVHRAPHVLLATVACDEHLIETPHASEAPAPLPESSGIRMPERSKPAQGSGQNELARAAQVTADGIVEQLVG